MDLTLTLPARLYLLAYRPDRRRLAQRSDLGLMLRAAALTDLLQRGLLRDERGTVRLGDPAPTRLDPLLAGVREQITDSRPRGWERWVRTGNHAAPRAVREQLVENGTLELEQYRVLGLLPRLRPVPSDPEPRERLLADFNAALTDPLPQVEPGAAALVALADAGRLGHLLSLGQRRSQRDRLRELAIIAGPAPSALRHAIRARHSVQSGG